MKENNNKKQNVSSPKLEEFLKEMGLRIDKSTTFSGPQTYMKMNEGEDAIIQVNKITYDWLDKHHEEIKDVRLDFTLLASSDREFDKYINCEMYWTSKSPEAREFFGTIENQKPIPKKPVIINRVNGSQWAFTGWD